MADIGIKENWLVDIKGDAKVQSKILDAQIQEKKSRIIRYKQDIDRMSFKRARLREGPFRAVEKEQRHLEGQRVQLQPEEALVKEDTNG